MVCISSVSVQAFHALNFSSVRPGEIHVAKELDFETIQQYTLEITVTDNAPEVSERRTVTAEVTVDIIDVDDTSSYDAVATLVQPRIASRSSAAFWAGIASSSALQIKLINKNNSQEQDISKDTDMVSFDLAKSSNLFSVDYLGGDPHVRANDQGASGRGVLVVQVKNVGNVEVNVTLAGVVSSEAQLLPYPHVEGAPEISELKQISTGRYQQGLVQFSVIMTDGFKVEVSDSANTSFKVFNANLQGYGKFGPSPKHLFTLEGNGLSGDLSIQASFGLQTASFVNVTLASQVSAIAQILDLKLQGQNSTLTGPAGSTKVHLFAELKFADGSSFGINNFTRYSGLLEFSSSNPGAASVDPASGVVTLLGDSNSQVIVTATAKSDPSIQATVAFYCNLQASAGGVDIGAVDGPPIPSLTQNEAWNLLVRVNPGSGGLLAVHVEVKFTTSELSVANVSTALHHSIDGDTITLTGPLGSAMSTEVAQISFVAQNSGVPSVVASSFRTVDTSLGVVPAKSAGPCNKDVLGDLNQDCELDIVDVAYIQAYVHSAKNGFGDSLGSTMKSLSVADVDINLSGSADDNDASLLSSILLGKAYFVADLSLLVPDHSRQSSERCDLRFSVKLTDREGNLVKPPTAEVYFDIAHGSAQVHAQFQSTGFSSGTKIPKDGSRAFGGLVKAVYSGGVFSVVSLTSKLQTSNLGVSVVQVVSDTVTPLFSGSSSPAYSGDVDVSLGPGDGRLQSKGGYSPQRAIAVPESGGTCFGSLATVEVEITFDGDYKVLVLGREKEFETEVHAGLSAKYPQAIFANFTFTEGSINTKFDMTTEKKDMNATIEKMWSDVKDGLKITSNGQEITSKPVMKVNEKDYTVEEATDEGGVSIYVIVGAIIGAVVLIVVLLVIIYCLWKKKKKKVQPSPPDTPKGYSDYASDHWQKESRATLRSEASLRQPAVERWQSVYLNQGMDEVWRDDDKVEAISLHSQGEDIPKVSIVIQLLKIRSAV